MALTKSTTPKPPKPLRKFNPWASPPTHDDHPDRGCEYSRTCLSCPLPKCVLDMTLPEQRHLRNRRRDSLRFAQVKYLKPRQAAKTLKISIRTYYRLAARVRAAFAIQGGQS